jgi:hypothetical protein
MSLNHERARLGESSCAIGFSSLLHVLAVFNGMTPRSPTESAIHPNRCGQLLSGQKRISVRHRVRQLCSACTALSAGSPRVVSSSLPIHFHEPFLQSGTRIVERHSNHRLRSSHQRCDLAVVQLFHIPQVNISAPRGANSLNCGLSRLPNSLLDASASGELPGPAEETIPAASSSGCWGSLAMPQQIERSVDGGAIEIAAGTRRRAGYRRLPCAERPSGQYLPHQPCCP